MNLPLNLPFVGRAVDERFLNRRLRAYQSGRNHRRSRHHPALCLPLLCEPDIWSWDLFIVIATILGVEMSVMAWYLLTDQHVGEQLYVS